jgi:DNA-binding response OmpR family regulator
VKRPKILVVDDSEAVLGWVKAALEAAGFEVTTQTSPFGFSSSLIHQRPDLVLLDVNLPALSGVKLAEIAVKNGLVNCPLLLYSDRPAPELAALAARCGAQGYVKKSRDSRALVDAIWRHLTPPPAGE